VSQPWRFEWTGYPRLEKIVNAGAALFPTPRLYPVVLMISCRDCTTGVLVDGVLELELLAEASNSELAEALWAVSSVHVA
jgi:hypothetical protein